MLPLAAPPWLHELQTAIEVGMSARVELVAVALQVNPQALQGRDPQTISAHELAEIILVALPQMVALDVPCGSPFKCRRCGAKLGDVIETHQNGKMVKGLHSSGVVWTDRDGRCLKCNARLFRK
jgi:hypothetical protein